MKTIETFNNKKLSLSILMCYAIGVSVYSFDPLMQSFPSIFINDFMKTFTTTSLGVSIIASSYFYSYNLMQIPAGLLCDRIGTKYILISSLFICMIALALFSQAHSLQTAIECRILMGLGASCAAVILVLICKEYFSITLFPILIGIAQLACNIGALSGQYPLTYLTSLTNWRISIFSLSLIPLLLILSASIFLKKNRYHTTTHQTFYDYLSEVREMFSNKNNWLIAIYAMLLWTPFYIFSSLWGIPFLCEKLDTTVTEASRLVAVSWIGSGIGSILIGILSSYYKKRKIFIMISAVIGMTITPFLILSTIHNIMLLSSILFIFGLSTSGQALSFTLIEDHNKNTSLGIAAGFNNTIIMLGPMLVDPIIGGLLKLNWNGMLNQGIPLYSITNFQLAFIVMPILFIMAFLMSCFYE